MRFRKLFAILMLASTAFAAGEVRKIIPIKYIDPHTLRDILKTFIGSSAFDKWQVDDSTRTVVFNLPEDTAKIVEDTIQRVDIPSAAPKDLELTAWFLTASDKEPASGTAPPPELDKVIAQLRNTFAFKNYRSIDALVLRTRTGQQAETSGTASTGPAPIMTQFGINRATIGAGEKGQVVRIDGLHAGLRVPVYSQTNNMNYVSTGLNSADIDIAEGQKVVVGKSSMEGPDKALIVVLSVKIL